MNGWQRIQAVASGQLPDRIPVFCNLFEQGATELGLSIREYYSKPENVAEGQLRLRRKYDYDNLWGAFYVGKEAGNHALPQHRINQLLVDLAEEGLNVVRLKGGDPFIFGRGGEEMNALLAAGLECEIVPGITAAAGAASCTGIPLTHREHAQTLVFATGHLKDDTVDLDWAALARPRQTVVIYMGLGALDIICERLIAHGLPAHTPAAVIHAATTPAQCGVHSTLARLPAAVREAGIRTPALIMIGEVVALDPGLLLRQALSATA